MYHVETDGYVGVAIGKAKIGRVLAAHFNIRFPITLFLLLAGCYAAQQQNGNCDYYCV
jgi:hypothetical protein